MKYKSNLIILVVLLTAGCSQKNSSAVPEDACKVITKTVAESAMQVTLADPRSQSFGENPRQRGISNCQYTGNPEQSVPMLNIAIRVDEVPNQPEKRADNFIASMKQTFGARYDLKKLDGLGDGAVWDESLKQLTVFRGAHTYAFTAPGATAPDLEQRMVALASQGIQKISEQSPPL